MRSAAAQCDWWTAWVRRCFENLALHSLPSCQGAFLPFQLPVLLCPFASNSYHHTHDSFTTTITTLHHLERSLFPLDCVWWAHERFPECFREIFEPRKLQHRLLRRCRRTRQRLKYIKNNNNSPRKASRASSP